MYNKLFTKILDSSIWLESTPTRIVWLTMIAVMDEVGFAQFASVGNVAHRARVTLEEANKALHTLESPDPASSDPANGGKRLQRLPGGWLVLNAEKHRAIVSRVVVQEQTRARVRKFRQRLKEEHLQEKPRQSHKGKRRSVTQSNDFVTPSNGRNGTQNHNQSTDPLVRTDNPERETRTASPAPSLSPSSGRDPFTDEAITKRAGSFVDRYASLYPKYRNGARYAVRPVRDYAAAVTLCTTWTDDARLEKLAICFLTTDHTFAAEGSRTLQQFLALASWCDGELAQWEKDRAATSRP